jgi:hypothetical protein
VNCDQSINYLTEKIKNIITPLLGRGAGDRAAGSAIMPMKWQNI